MDEKLVHIIKTFLSRFDVLLLMSIFGLYPVLKLSFKHISARKNLFLKACFCWDARLSLREMDRKFEYAGTVGYGDSYLDYLFCHSKVLRLQALPHDVAGALRSLSDKGPGYSCIVGPRAKSCLLGHVTGLFFCLHVKLLAIHFQLCRLLKHFVLHYTEY